MYLKKQELRIYVISVVLTVFFSGVIFSQEKIAKEIQETYEINSNTSLAIINKYGNIDIRNWNKNSLEVKVQIKTEKLSDNQIDELISLIEIDYGITDNKIWFKTSFDDKFSNTLNRLQNGDKNFEVNYIVNMPDNIPVDLSNKYGNIFVDQLSKASNIEVKYGNLKANSLTSTENSPLTIIKLGYAEANIENSEWLKVEIKYSKLFIEDSRALIVLSKYSKVYVENGSSIVSESKYDTYEIGSIANFVTDGAYSNIKIENLSKKLHSETQYTDIKIQYMPVNFREIKIINRYGSYNIGIDEKASYHIKGIGKYGNIVYPDRGRVNRFQESNELNIEGLIGDNNESKTKVTVDTKYGTIKLK